MPNGFSNVTTFSACNPALVRREFPGLVAQVARGESGDPGVPCGSCDLCREQAADAPGILEFLAANGVTVRRTDTGAINMGGRCAFVRERTRKDGTVEIVIEHQGSRGTSYQRFTSRDRALRAILSVRAR